MGASKPLNGLNSIVIGVGSGQVSQSRGQAGVSRHHRARRVKAYMGVSILVLQWKGQSANIVSSSRT